MVPSERTVTVAVGHGKKAARHIDAWLRGRGLCAAAEARARGRRQAQHLVLRGRAQDGAADARHACAGASTFDEVQGGLDETNALYEARRCLSCGNCFECDNCYGVCPDNAVIKLGPGQALRIQLRLLQGLRRVRRGVPLRRDRDGAGGDLIGERLRTSVAAQPSQAPTPTLRATLRSSSDRCEIPELLLTCLKYRRARSSHTARH